MDVGLGETIRVFVSDPFRFIREGLTDKPVTNFGQGLSVTAGAAFDVAQNAAVAVKDTAASAATAVVGGVSGAVRILRIASVIGLLIAAGWLLSQLRLFGFGKKG